MEWIPEGARWAAFRCVLALASPDGEVRLAHGECRGIILRAPRGTGGFGYDPVFLVPELGRTMAELSLEEKGRLSHRARALDALEPLLRSLAGGTLGRG
jgi:XTP/dITP diphosphohydrolase